jgi:hypothetical protein
MKKNKLCLALITAFLSGHVFAWNAVAHGVIATIAYENCNERTQQSIDHLVKVFSKEYPAMTQVADMAAWPDALHKQKIESFSHWHYIDVPLRGDGTAIKKRIDTDNAIWAINTLLPIIQNPHANKYERARALAFLIHIIGDMHQPLHTVSRVTADYPEGDLGGNLYPIIDPVSHKKVSLHQYWDSGLGVFSVSSASRLMQADRVKYLSVDIMTRYPREHYGAKISDTNPWHWANEGFFLSKTVAYSVHEKRTPIPAYVEAGRTISEQQVALAGYRLANVLNALFRNDL